MSATVDRENGAHTAATGISTPPRGDGSTGDPDRRRTTSAYLFYGSALSLILSTMCPWVTALGISGHVNGGGAVVLIVFAGIYARQAYRTRRNRVTRTLAFAAAWVVNTLMVLLMVGMFVILGRDSTGLVSPGAGLYLAILATASAIFATVQLHRSEPAR